jgi:hypothetical protein
MRVFTTEEDYISNTRGMFYTMEFGRGSLSSFHNILSKTT